MKNFLLLSVNLDIMPLLLAISRQPGLWDQHTIRTTHPGTPHAQVSDILLRFQDQSDYNEYGDTSSVTDNHESVAYPAWWVLPETRTLVFGLMARVSGLRLGRVMVTNLRPGCRIPPHVDSAPHSTYYERFHIILCSPPECAFRAEEEIVHMRPGECWWFQNGVEHEVWNDGATERWSLIIDIHCDAFTHHSGGDVGDVLSRSAAPVSEALAGSRAAPGPDPARRGRRSLSSALR